VLYVGGPARARILQPLDRDTLMELALELHLLAKEIHATMGRIPGFKM
jgi:hypothetical protein